MQEVLQYYYKMAWIVKLILPVDILVFKHKLMTKTIIYSTFMVQTTIIKSENFMIIYLPS